MVANFTNIIISVFQYLRFTSSSQPGYLRLGCLLSLTFWNLRSEGWWKITRKRLIKKGKWVKQTKAQHSPGNLSWWPACLSPAREESEDLADI